MALILAGGIVIAGILFPPVFAALLVPALWAGWRYLVVKCRVYELTSQRLRLYEGVINRKIDEIELYRVKDTNIEQPFWFRMFGLGVLNLKTSDRSHRTPSGLRDGVGRRVRKLGQGPRSSRR